MELSLKALARVKSILQKPKTLSTVDFSGVKLQRLASDVVELSKDSLSKLEQEVMNSLRKLKVESARIISENGELVEDLKYVGTKTRCELQTKLSTEELLAKTKNAICIHNHPENDCMLSTNDIVVMSACKYRKMVVCTPKGDYCYLERPLVITPEQEEAFDYAARKLKHDAEAKLSELKSKKLSDKKMKQQYQDWMDNVLCNLARNLEFKYERFTSCSNTSKSPLQLLRRFAAYVFH